MKVLIAGATGLVGGELLKAFYLNPSFTEVVILSRKPISELHGKGRLILTELGPDWLKPIESESFDAVFCVLGTTMKQAGSKEAFRKVDEEAVLQLARFSKLSGSRQFLFVSSVGASAHAQSFYLKVKGRVEKEIEKLSIPSTSILRPSIILGPRPEHRFGEELGKKVFQFFEPFFILGLRKYRAIEARSIAHAMVRLSIDSRPGTHYYESNQIEALSKTI